MRRTTCCALTTLFLIATACAEDGGRDEGLGGIGPMGDDGGDDGGDPGGDDGDDDGGDDTGDGSGNGDDGDDGDDDGSVRLDVPDGDGDGGGDDATCACAPKSDLIYLLAYNPLSNGELWTFDPQGQDFAKVTDIGCPGGVLDSVFSMAVSRSAKAWVQFQPSGQLFTIDVNGGGACTPAGLAAGNLGFESFGMAFVSDSVVDQCDDIYGVKSSISENPYECPGQGCGTLAVIDDAALTHAMVGDIDYYGGELTGTGDGRLFAFIGANPAKLVEFDKDTGDAIDVTPLAGLETTDAFAFAFWGGDFYFFTEANDTLELYPEAPSKVTHLDYDGSDGNGQALTTIVPAAPILVAGAGVSTCVPYEPPG